MRFIVAVCVSLLLAAGAVTAQESGAAGSSQNRGGTVIASGSTITIDQAVKIAESASLQTQLNTINLQTARSANAQVHAQNSLGLSGNAGLSRTSPFGAAAESTPGAPLSVVAKSVATDKASAGVDLSIPNSGPSPTTSVSVTGSHSISETDPLYQQTEVSASVKQTLWDGYPGFRNRLTVDEADVTLQQEILTAQSDLQSLVYQVKQAFYTMSSAQDTVSLDTRILQQRQRDYDQTKTLYDAGQATAVDLQQADVNRHSAQLDLNDAQNSLKQARVSLSLLIGVPADTEYSVATPPAVTAPTQSVQDLTNQALSQRVDLQKLLLTAKVNALQTTSRRTATSPVVTANAGIDYSYLWNTSQHSGGWNAGVQVTIPIVDAGTNAAQVEQSKLQERSTSIQIAQLKQQIAQTVQADFDSVKSLTARVSLAQQNRDLAQKQYQLTEIQFKQGTKSQLDVLNASVALSQSETSLQQAQNKLELAIIQLSNDLRK